MYIILCIYTEKAVRLYPIFLLVFLCYREFAWETSGKRPCALKVEAHQVDGPEFSEARE